MEKRIETDGRIFKVGLALDLTVRITGGVEYKRANKVVRLGKDGARIEDWETEKITRNPEEYQAAVALRASIRNSITRLCARTPLGDLLLVPPDRESDVREALDEASKLVSAHNAKAGAHFLVLGAVPSRFVPEDVWTARSIKGEILATLATIEAGIGSCDVDRIRDACDSARKILPMLEDGPKIRISAAIEDGRRAAREITRRVTKNGEDPVDVVGEIQENRLVDLYFALATFANQPDEAPEKQIA